MIDNDVLLSDWAQAIGSRLIAVEGWSVGPKAPSSLLEACRYVSAGGGKRLRGLLACSVAHDLFQGGNGSERAISSAVALELLHAASLVHDDLPALDNDDLRRGRASCHKAFGEATAILTGDALVGAAFMVVAHDTSLSSDNQARVIRTLSHAWWDLCLGQQFDLDQQRGSSPVGRDEMVRLKTGALFGAAVGCGAVCGGIRESVLDEYIAWGTRVGECFQALDDVDDGDRRPEERDAIERECRDALAAASVLNARLTVGTTKKIVEQIFGFR
jgi:geranylgeranyl diphosphate synthase type II